MKESKIDRKNDNSDLKICFKNRNKYFKVNNIIKIGCFILIAAVSGAVSANLIIGSTFSEDKVAQIIAKRLNDKKNSLQDSFSKAIEKVSYSLVTISNDESNLGKKTYEDGNITGVIVRKDGYIVTSYSEVKDYEEIFVNVPTPGVNPVEGKLMGYDESTDIALIKISANDLTPIEIADDSSYREGEFVVSIGNSISDDFVGISLPGVITSTNEKIVDEEGNQYRVVQTNTILNDFNNGGPICDVDGKLIAFNSKAISNKFGGTLLNFSLRGTELVRVIDRLISLTDVLGIGGGIPFKDSEKEVEGVYVSSVKSGGYASKAGIRPTDIIVNIDGEEINNPEDIYYAVKDREVGEVLKCDILRDGVRTSVKIIIE